VAVAAAQPEEQAQMQTYLLRQAYNQQPVGYNIVAAAAAVVGQPML
jgi:hypothetical protein